VDLQHPADRLDPELLAVVVDERRHHRSGRSSSAWAKYADALGRISFARRVRFGLTHPVPSAPTEQTILSAIERIAGARDRPSSRNTIRTARSRTSDGHGLSYALAPSPRMMEPPEVPVRLTAVHNSTHRSPLVACPNRSQGTELEWGVVEAPFSLRLHCLVSVSQRAEVTTARQALLRPRPHRRPRPPPLRPWSSRPPRCPT
jgi:hypothetical protein